MSDAREFELVVAPGCAIGEAEARAIVASSRPAGGLRLTDDDVIAVNVTALCPPGKVYVIDRSRHAPPSPV